MNGNGNAAMSAAQTNMAARALITSRAVKMTQKIFSSTFNPANGNVVNVIPRNVGLILGFWIEVNATIADPGAGMTYNITNLGAANALQQVLFYDLNNNIRVQTSGWHLHAVNSAKKKRPFGSCDTLISYPMGYGNNFGGNLAANQSQNLFQAASVYDHTHFAQGVQMLYWLPLAYSDFDLRGAIYANVVNATMNMQLTLTPSAQAFVANATDPTLALYEAAAGSSGGAWGTQVTINVYQVYYDQLPVAQNGAPVLPISDLSTIYELKNTALTGLAAGQDFPIPYSNFRDFLSTFAIFDNQTGGAYPVAGSDINYWALQSANFTNIFNVAPKYVGMWDRSEIGDDFPTGLYYFPTRDKPISTVQYGNMNLVLNASTVNAGAQVLMGYEDFALVNSVVGAASLSTAG